MADNNKRNDITEGSNEISLTLFLVIVMQNDLVTGNEKNEPTWKQCLLGVGLYNNNSILYIYNLILTKMNVLLFPILGWVSGDRRAAGGHQRHGSEPQVEDETGQVTEW